MKEEGKKMLNKSSIKHFTDLKVWQKAHLLFVEIYRAIEKHPQTCGARIIADQILRSTSSISANIAEGFNARSTKMYVHYLDIAQRSAAETENWIYKIIDCNFMVKKSTTNWLNVCWEIEKMTQSLIRSLSKSPKKR